MKLSRRTVAAVLTALLAFGFGAAFWHLLGPATCEPLRKVPFRSKGADDRHEREDGGPDNVLCRQDERKTRGRLAAVGPALSKTESGNTIRSAGELELRASKRASTDDHVERLQKAVLKGRYDRKPIQEVVAGLWNAQGIELEVPYFTLAVR